jgi:hypothetical protein
VVKHFDNPSWAITKRKLLCRRVASNDGAADRAASCAVFVYLDCPLALAGADLAALEDAKVLPVLCGIRKGIEVLNHEHPGRAGKQLRTRLNFVKANIDLAIRAARGVDTESTMNRAIGTIRAMSSIVAYIGGYGNQTGDTEEKEDLFSFIHFLQATGVPKQPPKLKAGFGNPLMGTAAALRLVVLHLERQTLGDIRQGPVSYPRLGRLVVRTSGGRSRDLSRVFFN